MIGEGVVVTGLYVTGVMPEVVGWTRETIGRPNVATGAPCGGTTAGVGARAVTGRQETSSAWACAAQSPRVRAAVPSIRMAFLSFFVEDARAPRAFLGPSSLPSTEPAGTE